MKWRFVVVFLLAFTGLLVTWGALNVGTIYRSAVLYAVHVLSPSLTGWWFEPAPPPPRSYPIFVAPGETIELVINPATLSLAQIPLLSLILATLGLRGKETVLRCLIGASLLYVVHILVILLYPFLLEKPNLWKDSLGVFTGLLSFVLAPQLLWFVLTYRQLQSLWRLESEPSGRKQ